MGKKKRKLKGLSLRNNNYCEAIRILKVVCASPTLPTLFGWPFLLSRLLNIGNSWFFQF